tara:strand:- start:672 stop:899 length:228 start_codon:yes stop_codon:yes gene_type:complete
MRRKHRTARPARPERPKKKKILSAWMWETDINVIKQLAKDNDVTVTAILKTLLSELDKAEDEAKNKIIELSREQL